MLLAAIDSAVRFVDGVKADQWSNATPCDEWDMQALVSHITYESLWAVELFAGKTMEEVSNRFERVFGQPAPVNTIWIVRDFNNFHARKPRWGLDEPDLLDEGNEDPPNEPGQRNYLYIDGHVADYEKY